jgi:hypothetical protein
MAETRRDPRVEGRAARRELRRALTWAVVAVGIWVLVNTYGSDEQWMQVDEQTRERIIRGAIGLPAVLAIWALVKCLFRARRWREARRWERMLADPATAPLVPPLTAHLETVSPPSWRSAVSLVLLVAGALGITVYGVLSLTGRVAPLRTESGEDTSVVNVIVGVALLLLFGFGTVRRVRRSRVARAVERLSSDPALAPPPQVAADVADRRAASIPHLHVTYGREQSGLDPRLLSHAPRRPTNEPLEILYLRLFDNVAGTTRFLSGPWRRAGYVYLLRSATQVEMDEVESAEDSGSMAALFISTAEQLEAAIAAASTGRHDDPPPDGFVKRWRWRIDNEHGRYPAPALLCHSSFWKSAVDLLLARVDLVALDLSGYRPQHAGTRYELQRVIDRFPVDRLLVLAEMTSDRSFLTAQINAAWAQMADGSPNAGADPRTVYVQVDV